LQTAPSICSYDQCTDAEPLPYAPASHVVAGRRMSWQAGPRLRIGGVLPRGVGVRQSGTMIAPPEQPPRESVLAPWARLAASSPGGESLQSLRGVSGLDAPVDWPSTS
jgi:hypothetical protein